jgi:hypothetical protein
MQRSLTATGQDVQHFLALLPAAFHHTQDVGHELAAVWPDRIQQNLTRGRGRLRRGQAGCAFPHDRYSLMPRLWTSNINMCSRSSSPTV